MAEKIPLQYIANLSRLSLLDSEIESLSKDMVDIISLMDTIKEINLDDIPITEHISGMRNVMREDVAKDPMNTKDILSNTEHKMDNCFVVPKLID